MFCPSCGTEYTIELKYCNRCGANLNTAIGAQTEIVSISVTKPTLILGTIIFLLTVGGFGMLLASAVDLSRAARLDTPAISMIVLMGMLTILITDIFLVRLLTKIINASLAAGPAQTRRSKALDNRPVVQLPQPSLAQRQGMPSVTEGTTRFFEPAQTQFEISSRTTVDKLAR